jgi:hypothetical protein
MSKRDTLLLIEDILQSSLKIKKYSWCKTEASSITIIFTCPRHFLAKHYKSVLPLLNFT